MILNRRQFKTYFDSLDPRLSVRGGPLWIPESFDDQRIRCRWFVKVRPLAVQEHDELNEYWQWCETSLSGQARCFSSDSKQEEWWGFTHRRDITYWLLKWTR